MVTITLSVVSNGALKPGIHSRKKTRSGCVVVGSLMEPGKAALSAADALAFFLRIDLRKLKWLERKRSGAPVRNFGLLPRSVIGEVALDLFDCCRTRNCPPGYHLMHLLRELLNLDVDRRLTAHDKAKARVAFDIARNPKITTRELARSIDMEPSTVLRWRKSFEFKKQVELIAQKIASLPAVDKEMSAEDFFCHCKGFSAKNDVTHTDETALALPYQCGRVLEWDVPFHTGSTARVIYRIIAPCQSNRRNPPAD